MATYTFDIDLACLYGVDESIMLQNLLFWIKKNQANKKHYYNNCYWTYNSVDAFKELFPFWSIKQVRRVLDSLINQGVILKDSFNGNPFDKTSWYALSDNCSYLLGNSHLPVSANPLPQKGNCITDINTDSKPNDLGSTPQTLFTPPEPTKKQDPVYREFKHLKLLNTEFDKLKALGFTVAQIDGILDGIENYKKNTNYASLYLTAKKWLEKEYPNNQQAEAVGEFSERWGAPGL